MPTAADKIKDFPRQDFPPAVLLPRRRRRGRDVRHAHKGGQRQEAMNTLSKSLRMSVWFIFSAFSAIDPVELQRARRGPMRAQTRSCRPLQEAD
jgi:hypothetical protein